MATSLPNNNDTRSFIYRSSQLPTQAFQYTTTSNTSNNEQQLGKERVTTEPESDQDRLKENQTPPPPHIKRPMNAFMLWSQAQRKTMAESNPDMKNSEISCVLGKRWKELGETDRAVYITQSQKLREEHMKRYPDFKYRPKSKKAAAKRAKVAAVDAMAAEITRPRPKPYDHMGPVPNYDEHLHRNVLSQRNENLMAAIGGGGGPHAPSVTAPPNDYPPSWTYAYSSQYHRPIITLCRQVGEIGSLSSPYDSNIPLSPTKNDTISPPEHPPTLQDQRRNVALAESYLAPRSRDFGGSGREFVSSSSGSSDLSYRDFVVASSNATQHSNSSNSDLSYNAVLFNDLASLPPPSSSYNDYYNSVAHYAMSNDYPALHDYTS